jgi:chemotaxis-related protein WspD
MITLPVDNAANDCWNAIGVRGDRTCPELKEFVHCQNCPVFAAAGRRFLDNPSPEGYLDEWTGRLAEIPETESCDTISVLVFQISDEWLALPVQSLVEVTTPRPVHRVPYRSGLLAGLVNIRGELHLCVHLSKLLGIGDPPVPTVVESRKRYLVTSRAADRWVFPVDSVDQVCRISRTEVQPPPVTVKRATSHLTSSVFSWNGHAVGLLDDARVFETLQRKLR